MSSAHHNALVGLFFQNFLFDFKPALLMIAPHASAIIFFNDCFGFSEVGFMLAMLFEYKSTLFTLFGSTELLMVAELGVSSAKPVSLVVWIKFEHFRCSKDVVVFWSDHLRLRLNTLLLS